KGRLPGAGLLRPAPPGPPRWRGPILDLAACGLPRGWFGRPKIARPSKLTARASALLLAYRSCHVLSRPHSCTPGMKTSALGRRLHAARITATREPLPQLNGNRLRLGVVLQHRFAVLAAMARHLEAAERRRGINDVIAVHPHRPCLHFA